MPKNAYHVISISAVLLATLAAYVVWRWADSVYQTDQWRGWLLGISGLGLPCLASVACLWWFHAARKRGWPAPRGYWLRVTAAMGGLAWASVLLFSVM